MRSGCRNAAERHFNLYRLPSGRLQSLIKFRNAVEEFAPELLTPRSYLLTAHSFSLLSHGLTKGVPPMTVTYALTASLLFLCNSP